MRFRWAVALLVVLVAIVVGSVAYDAGVSHGLAVSGQAAVTAPVAPYPYPYPYGWYRPWGFGFFFFPFLIVGFWLLMVRGLFWGRPWHRRWHHAGPYDLPPAFEEWHRRSHERMTTDPQSGVTA